MPVEFQMNNVSSADMQRIEDVFWGGMEKETNGKSLSAVLFEEGRTVFTGVVKIMMRDCSARYALSNGANTRGIYDAAALSGFVFPHIYFPEPVTEEAIDALMHIASHMDRSPVVRHHGPERTLVTRDCKSGSSYRTFSLYYAKQSQATQQ